MNTRTYNTVTIDGWKVSNPFRVITEHNTEWLCEEDNLNYEDKVESLFNEQMAALDNLNIDFGTVVYLVKFGNGHTHEMTIEEAIQVLALKDGSDLVEFEDGNVGFVGYYYGINENWFEIIGEANNE